MHGEKHPTYIVMSIHFGYLQIEARTGKKRNADGDLVGKPEDERQLPRPNIKIT
jgi:hypothetical protein